MLALDRFFTKIDIGNSPAGCWMWTGGKSPKGYGQFSLEHHINVRAHRYAYEQMVGPIHGVIDHLCREPSCVNPLHLEDVSHRENIMRGDTLAAANTKKTHCPQGHAFTLDNTGLTGPTRTERYCRACRRASCQAWRERQKEKIHGAS